MAEDLADAVWYGERPFANAQAGDKCVLREAARPVLTSKQTARPRRARRWMPR